MVFTHVPPAGVGADSLEHIRGRIANAPAETAIILYAQGKGGSWWVQPFRSRAFTEITPDGTWENYTHLGQRYAALLVRKSYQPAMKISQLPTVSGEILSVAAVDASLEKVAAPKVIHFSGYDWAARSTANYEGGNLSEYEPANAWVDDNGYLHLLMGQVGKKWYCGGISLTRSLGYGTYRFVIADTSHLPVSAVFSIYTADSPGNEMNIEVSRWGKLQNKNLGYVIQPYYVPGNASYSELPTGTVTHVLRWEPGSAVFKTFAGASPQSQTVKMERVFKSGIPVPTSETVHMSIYDFRHSQSGLQHPVEVVVQKFEYLP